LRKTRKNKQLGTGKDIGGGRNFFQKVLPSPNPPTLLRYPEIAAGAFALIRALFDLLPTFAANGSLRNILAG